MDYPTEEEQFELMYGDELEMMDESDDVINVTKNLPQPSTSKSDSSGFGNPNFSQISRISHDEQPVNRRLFGTPIAGPSKRISSTPMPTILDVPDDIVPVDVLAEVQNIGLNRKRRLDDLFGDIHDIDDDICLDNAAKKLKNEEERDLEQIEKIIEARKQMRESKNPLNKDAVARLQALHAFKMRNLSYTVPNWSFLPLVKSNEDRVYVRFHSEDLMKKEIFELNLFSKGYSGLLGEKKAQIWSEARELILKRTTNVAVHPMIVSTRENVSTADNNLWVEKYKPKKYIDLLSDETTNRSLLYWLKMWDKVVFGREFKTVEVKNAQLNSFNKKTGKFVSNGGWTRKSKQNLNTDRDDHGRPMQKISLLCGPPGLGKTTLAHTIAKHAGYTIREINASDDRSPEAFRLALENGTQMTSVLNEQRRPNCIILDEIDGAPTQSIDFLIKFITGNVTKKSKKGTKAENQLLKRPIICICNDMYVPALRQLRQVAFVVNFPPIESARLADRLLDISLKEGMKTDLSSLIALAEKSGNDVRSCISMMQFFNARKQRLGLQDVLTSNLGQKDRQRGLFGVWSAIFQIQRPKKQVSRKDNFNTTGMQLVTMTDMSATTRMQNVLDAVHMGGDYERLMQGVYENYLGQKMPDPNLSGVVEATKWFCFQDIVQSTINKTQNYAIYPYLQFGFVVWHLLFASLAWPKINFPSKGFEFNQKITTHKMILQSFKKGITSDVMGVGQGRIIVVDTLPCLKKILSPNLRSVSIQLLTPKERYDLQHSVEIMSDLGLTFTQMKTADGTYQYQLEPDLDLLSHFNGFPGITLSYFGRQLIAREVELENMRRVTPKVRNISKTNVIPEKKKPVKQKNKEAPTKALPNHLQTLEPRLIRNSNLKETISKDFFGRMTTKQTNLTVQEGGTDLIVKSPIWYRYKEGFNNAVRKDIKMFELL